MPDFLIDLLILAWWPQHWRWWNQILLMLVLVALLAAALVALALLL
jgi:hypothetical protein